MSDQPQDARGVSPTPVPFIHDASRNLRVVRRQFGPHSRCYRRLRLLYSRAAHELGCWRELQRRCHPLHRRGLSGTAQPWTMKTYPAHDENAVL